MPMLAVRMKQFWLEPCGCTEQTAGNLIQSILIRSELTIAHIRIHEGYLYLADVVDLFSSMGIGMVHAITGYKGHCIECITYGGMETQPEATGDGAFRPEKK